MIDLTSTRLSIMKEMRKQIDDVEFAALVSNVIHDVDVLRERSPYIESDDESERVKNRTSLVRNCQELVQEFK